MAIRPQEVFYDWHVHEAFNFFQRDGEIYVPHGSGDLFANYVTWQMITGLHGAAKKDIRLRVHPSVVASLDILGAMPSETKSNADKREKYAKPESAVNSDKKQSDNS